MMAHLFPYIPPYYHYLNHSHLAIFHPSIHLAIYLLGECALIDEIMVGEDKLIRFSGCKSGSACSIILRGASSHLLDEAERSMHDALCVLTGNFSPSLSLLSPPSSCICCMPYLTFHNMI